LGHFQHVTAPHGLELVDEVAAEWAGRYTGGWQSCSQVGTMLITTALLYFSTRVTVRW
jgi:hypothetical protein